MRIAEDWKVQYIGDGNPYSSMYRPILSPHTLDKIKVYCKLLNSHALKYVTPAELDTMVERLASMRSMFWSPRDAVYAWEEGDYYFHLPSRRKSKTAHQD